MKMKLIAVLSVILCVTGTFAASNAHYVQDGLITHFDAIDNAGTGAHVSYAGLPSRARVGGNYLVF